MDGREAMSLPGSASYYMQRSVSGAQTGIHGPSGFRPLSNPNIQIQSNIGGNSLGSTFPQVESPSGISSHGVGISQGEPIRRKRGRPRKYGPDGGVSLGLSPMSSTPPASSTLTPNQKRGRGRPPGTGRKQQLASLGKFSY